MKDLLRNFTLHQKKTVNNLTLKQMFDTSEKLIVEESDEMFGVTPMNWEDSSWKHFSLVSDEEIISLSHAKVFVFSDSVLCLGKVNQNPTSIVVGKNSWVGSKIHRNTEFWKQLTENRWNSSGIFSRISLHFRSSTKSKGSSTKWATQHKSTNKLTSCRCF